MTDVTCKPDGKPTAPAPKIEVVPARDNTAHPCDGTLKIECCCEPCPPALRIHTRTVGFNIPGGTSAVVTAAALAVLNAWEAGGWLVLAHSIRENDTQGGYSVLMTAGWYAP